MKYNFFLMLLLVLTTLLGRSQTFAQESFNNKIKKNVEILFQKVLKNKNKLEIELEIVNQSTESIYILVEPRTYTGQKGIYISGIARNNSILELSCQFYENPKYFISVYAAGTKVKELASKSRYLMKESLNFPLYPTLPPYGANSSIANKAIKLENLTKVSFTIGLLPFDKGIEGLLTFKKSKTSFEDYFDGGEIIQEGVFNGKQLVDLQSVISATYDIPKN